MTAYISTLNVSLRELRPSGRSNGLNAHAHFFGVTLRRPRYQTLRQNRLKVVASAPQVSYEEKTEVLSTPKTGSITFPRYRNVLREIFVGVRELAEPLYGGERKVTAWLWTAATVILALAATLYAVMLSMIQRFFWNSLNARDASQFGKLLMLYGVAVVIGPIVISVFNWITRRLALMWRRILTDHLLRQYFSNLNYYRLSLGMWSIDNPDQRIAEDVERFTSRAVRFITVIGVGVFDLVVFSVLLYKVYKPLLFLLIGYSAIGTVAIGRVGRHLLVLNREQASREADFRFGLVRVRDSTENIAFYGGEESEQSELFGRFGSVFRNKISLLGLTRTVELMSSSFRYWAQVAPTALIAPQYFAGKVPLGALSQVYFSFNHVLSSLGLVVSEFTALAEFGAGIRRLKGLSDALNADAGRRFRFHAHAAVPGPCAKRAGECGARGAAAGGGAIGDWQKLADAGDLRVVGGRARKHHKARPSSHAVLAAASVCDAGVAARERDLPVAEDGRERRGGGAGAAAREPGVLGEERGAAGGGRGAEPQHERGGAAATGVFEDCDLEAAVCDS
ncbi:ABC transporter type 1 [Gracilaria domingensis]|nr:ABC transporter type 1 [Gracilaria domingensis]